MGVSIWSRSGSRVNMPGRSAVCSGIRRLRPNTRLSLESCLDIRAELTSVAMGLVPGAPVGDDVPVRDRWLDPDFRPALLPHGCRQPVNLLSRHDAPFQGAPCPRPATLPNLHLINVIGHRFNWTSGSNSWWSDVGTVPPIFWARAMQQQSASEMRRTYRRLFTVASPFPCFHPADAPEMAGGC